jgi:Ala-tRNA(Pro) deacylase
MTPAALEALLRDLGLTTTTYPHPPIFTVDEGRDLKLSIPGVHSKNLFLKDKAGRLVLVCASAETRVDLNGLAKVIGAGRLSFASAELLHQVLGVTPGSVTIFALANDRQQQVRLVLDAALLEADLATFHPLSNAASTTISPGDLRHFLAHTGHNPTVVRFAATSSPMLIEPDGQTRHISGDKVSGDLP